jgi:hypothetical protein
LPDGAKRIVYVPETLKAQLRDEIKREVMAQAKQEGWAAPDAVPAWLRRFNFGGDVRVRWERDLFGAGNANDGSFPDFNGINTAKPVNVVNADPANDRFLNTDQNRTRPRMRARLGTVVDLGQGFSAGVRLASGDTSGPVSTTTLASTGNFSKYAVWLDRGYIRLDADAGRGLGLTAVFGRFENPFFATDMVWSDVVSVDGAAVRASGALGGGAFRPFLVGGAFPLYTTAFDFPTESTQKLRNLDKWLFAGQVGFDWRPGPRVGLKLGGAFYFFNHVEGRISTPCDTSAPTTTCDTDLSRPQFAQKGNTYMTLRTPNDVALQAETSGGAEYQYFGLASRFRELVFTAQADAPIGERLEISVEGEFARNAGFSRKQIEPVAFNNRAACDASGNCHRFAGGPNGYHGRLTVGSPTQSKRWDWNVSLGYRHVETDAVVDAFVNPDFGLGGTNLKGYVLGANLAVADAVWLGARWSSADAIAGPTYRVDVLQVDLRAGF